MDDHEYSPQRATKVAAAASLGTLLALAGVMTVGADSSSSSAPAAVLSTTVASTVTPTTVAPTTVAPTTVTTVCSNTYTVHSGDYWLLLAEESGVAVDELYAVNGAGPDTALFAGTSICLPDGATVVTVAPATTAAPVVTAAAPVVTAAQTTRASG